MLARTKSCSNENVTVVGSKSITGDREFLDMENVESAKKYQIAVALQ
jgi:hypothetical protein